MKQYRTETDLLGYSEIPADSLWGMHTARALENFQISGRAVHPELVKAYGSFKLACFPTNRKLGYSHESQIDDAIEQAGSSIMPGKVNPVIHEVATQAAILVMAHDVVIAQAAAYGNLELNQFIPEKCFEFNFYNHCAYSGKWL